MNKLVASLAACLPICAISAPAQSPSFICSANAIEAYAPGSWNCHGDLTLADGTIDTPDSLLFRAEGSLTLRNVELKAKNILLAGASVVIDTDSKVDATGSFILGSNLILLADPSFIWPSPQPVVTLPVLTGPLYEPYRWNHSGYGFSGAVMSVRGSNANPFFSATPLSVPEPADVWLVLAGCGLLAWQLRRPAR